ncbi:MAG: TIGR03086 family metal-binding protein [Actinomycetota bacterium]|nr:TIGR03086 family metal-binding protein [Actinomycetota bacterium]
MKEKLPELHRLASDGVTARVMAIREDQWELPTPNPGWDVRYLVNHLVEGSVWVAPLLEGETIEEIGDRFEGDLLGDDPKGAWRRAAAEATAACFEKGAMDRTVDLSRGPAKAHEYILERIADLAMHTWDLARAIGADETIDPDVVEAGRALLADQGKLWRQYGLLGPIVETAPGADPQTLFLAESGRKA